MKAISQNSKVLILGLGKTGYSCARYLDAKCQVTVLDSRDHPPYRDALISKASFRGICRCGTLELPESELTKFDLVVVSPGIARDGELFQRIAALELPLCGDLDLFTLEATKPIVAITGSNGKTTVTDMLGFVVNEFSAKKALVGGNIGVPVLDLLTADTEADFYVLELSSFQIETLKQFRANIATVLNVSDDHLDRYESFAAYRQVKLSLLERADRVVVNHDSSANYQYTGELSASFGLEDLANNSTTPHRAYLHEGNLCLDNKSIVAVSELKIKGQHNYLNALAVLAMGQEMGLELSELAQGLAAYPGLPHRCQWIGRHQGVDYVNDSKATNVGAAIAALEGVAQGKNVIWLLGGDGKGADFSPLLPAAKKTVKQALCFGKDGAVLQSLLSTQIPCTLTANLQEAVQQARTLANSGDVVLLSPACASLDMFHSFEERGDAFVTAVGGVP